MDPKEMTTPFAELRAAAERLGWQARQIASTEAFGAYLLAPENRDRTLQFAIGVLEMVGTHSKATALGRIIAPHGLEDLSGGAGCRGNMEMCEITEFVWDLMISIRVTVTLAEYMARERALAEARDGKG